MKACFPAVGATGRSKVWTAPLTIVSLVCWVTLASPVRGQQGPEPATDVFDGIQRDLNVAADAQLAEVRSQVRPERNLSPETEADVRSRTAQHVEPLIGNLSTSAAFASELRFRSMGVDARRIFREIGVPVEFLAVAQVESNFNPNALSSKGALGLWQLMPATARRYGLWVDGLRDDRTDADKATRAAAHYLRDLHDQFRDWLLALAAYNAGERVIQRAMKRATTADFWSLSSEKVLPEETRNYVPAVLAVMGDRDNSPRSAYRQFSK